MFFNLTFGGLADSIGDPPDHCNNINKIILSDGLVDDLYITKKIYTSWDGSIPDNWDFDTHLKATFENNLYGGNVNYTADIVQLVRIKVREKGSFKWRTIYEKPIETDADLNFEIYDPLNPSNTMLEYAYVPVINGNEGDTSTNEIFSKFDGFFLVEKDKAYHALLNINNEYQLNRETATVTTMGRKHPYIIENGMTNHYSGTFKATFVQDDGNCVFDFKNGYKYRRDVDEFLSDGKPKILKDFEGKIWMVQIVDNISLDHSHHYQAPTHSMEWVEVGRYDSVGDLYDNNFIDTDYDRE